jgi:hypothetical protein
MLVINVSLAWQEQHPTVLITATNGRILGTSSDLTKTCANLKDIYRNSITALPLRDYFDIVRCNGPSGLLLVLSLFVEEWYLDVARDQREAS